MREADLLRAFSNATAEAFGVDGDHVRDVSARYVTGNLHFDFELRRPAVLTKADVNARLKECAYAAVWALYEPRPLEEEKKAVTTHELGFEGEDWDYVLERRRAEVRDVLPSRRRGRWDSSVRTCWRWRSTQCLGASLRLSRSVIHHC
ncbi:hypothetical protein TcBrA4_0096630 [Trypanosoma cruzi]|nr:hypothetical protein TcBrA4_0096630 [Trypanosoma cruzi]